MQSGWSFGEMQSGTERGGGQRICLQYRDLRAMDLAERARLR